MASDGLTRERVSSTITAARLDRGLVDGIVINTNRLCMQVLYTYIYMYVYRAARIYVLRECAHIRCPKNSLITCLLLVENLKRI